MKAGQTSIRNGVQDILFPMEYMNITQGNDGQYSHQGANALDLAGRDTGRDVFYAPFDVVCKAVDAKNGNAVWWESQNKVRFADGTIDYATIMIIHDNSLSGIYVGANYSQGQQIAQEGTAGNATGNHNHFEIAKGKYTTMYVKNGYGVYQLKDSISADRACFVDGTRIVNGASMNWKVLADVSTSNSPSSRTLTLPGSATSWNVYPLDKAPIVGNQCGKLNPSLFGGLTYEILSKPQPNVVTIQTRDFGKVNIYVGAETGAIMK